MIWQERTGRIEQVPWQADWLSAGEQDVIRSSRSHRGRFAARLLAKQLLAEHYRSVDHYNQIHIESRDGRDRSTRPQAYISGRLIPWNISLSHSERIVSAAILPTCNGRIGLDLVDPAALSVRPLKYWLTFAEAERAMDQLSMGIIWSLKEAIYKASNEGTPFFPRHVDTATYLSSTAWSCIDRDVRIQGRATRSISNGWELSLNVVDGTIRTLVWCRPESLRYKDSQS